MSAASLKAAVFGTWPMATKMPFTGSTVSAPVLTFFTLRPLTAPSATPSTLTGTLSHTGWIFGCEVARSAMILEARSESRRWTR